MDLTTLVAFLAPVLPFLLKGGEEAAKAAGAKFGDAAWERAKTIWSKLHPKVVAKEAAREAVQDVAKAPDDEDARASLRQQLKKLFAEDTALASEIAQQLTEAKAAGVVVTVSGDRAVGIGGSMSGGTIITGDQPATKPRRK
jgi:hypothetical protein